MSETPNDQQILPQTDQQMSQNAQNTLQTPQIQASNIQTSNIQAPNIQASPIQSSQITSNVPQTQDYTNQLYNSMSFYQTPSTDQSQNQASYDYSNYQNASNFYPYAQLLNQNLASASNFGLSNFGLGNTGLASSGNATSSLGASGALGSYGWMQKTGSGGNGALGAFGGGVSGGLSTDGQQTCKYKF